MLSHYFNGPITIIESLNQYTNLQLELLRDGDVVLYKKEAQTKLTGLSASLLTAALLRFSFFVTKSIRFSG